MWYFCNKLQRSKPSSLSDSKTEKIQQNKLYNNQHLYIDDNDNDFEGSGGKGEVIVYIYFLCEKV